MEKDRDASALRAAADFLRRFGLQALAVSAGLLVPCFWHRRIEAGDLASHVYNAWLAQLIERGQAPGIYVARQWNNVLFDLFLLKFAKLFGLPTAQKILVPLCVLIFFWGAFALIAAVSRRLPWFLLPCLAMLAYGWTFNVGFFNYYLSLGLGFFATAIVWSGRCTELILAATIAGLVLIAHPQGFVWLAGCVGYVVLWRLLPGWWKLAVPGAAVLAVVVARLYLMTHYESFGVWDTFSPGIYNGSDQLALYGMRYYVLSGVALLFGVACFVADGLRRGRTQEYWAAMRLPLELHWFVVFAIYVLPDVLRLPNPNRAERARHPASHKSRTQQTSEAPAANAWLPSTPAYDRAEARPPQSTPRRKGAPHPTGRNSACHKGPTGRCRCKCRD